MPTATVTALYRYPVKGLSPEALHRVALTPDHYFPGDRHFAIENGDSSFDASLPVHKPKIHYLMLMRQAKLAALKTHYEEAIDTLTITAPDGTTVVACLATEEGEAKIAAFFSAYCKDDLRGVPRLLRAPHGFAFTDSRRGFVSILNLASVRALSEKLGMVLDPQRFRANVHVEGWPAFAEFELVGKLLAAHNNSGADSAQLEVLKRIERCAATNVNPTTAARDCNIPDSLLRFYDHTDCGIYANVAQSGALAIDDELVLV